MDTSDHPKNVVPRYTGSRQDHGGRGLRGIQRAPELQEVQAMPGPTMDSTQG